MRAVTSASLGQQLWDVQNTLSSLIYDPARTFGIGWNVKQVRHVTWQLKERLSHDTWRILQQLDKLPAATR